MKTQSHQLILASALTAVGLTIGWLIGGKATAATSLPTVKSPPNSARRDESQRLTTKIDAKWQTFVTHISEISYGEREAFVGNITSQDRRSAIEVLLKQGGPRGFDSEIEQSIDQLLASWGKENFEDAWAWSQQIHGEGTKNFIVGRLLNLLVKTNPERALTLYLELEQTYPGFKSEVPAKVLASAALKNSEEFLNFATKFRFSWDQGEPCEFAKDFNFQQVADGIAKFSRKEDSKLPWGFPRNFYKAWADRDQDAAFASFTRGELKRLGDFEVFLWGLRAENNPNGVWSWVAEKIQESEVSSKAIAKGLGNIPAVSFNELVKALPDESSRDRFLTEVARERGICHRQDGMPSIAISAMSSPEVRLEAFAQMHKRQIQPDVAKVTEADLQAWGVTRQQIIDIFSVPVDKLPNSN
jgi:hypothetical protein